MTYAIRNSANGQAVARGLPSMEDAEKLRDFFVNSSQLYISPEAVVDSDPLISVRLPRSTWADLINEMADHSNLRTLREHIAATVYAK